MTATRVDVGWLRLPGTAELLSLSAALAFRLGDLARIRAELRPVFCPRCSTHFSTLIPPGVPRAPTCVHYVCLPCGGDGRPFTLEAPR